ncbi:MAG: OmpH family outer membrane protein [Pararhodobacter sp.]
MARTARLFMLAGALHGALALFPSGAGMAQDAAPTAQAVTRGSLSVRSLDQERLFQESALGRRIIEGLEAARQELEAENQRLFEQLATEEQQLTELRATLSPEEFRQRADAFDARVEAIRAERGEASQALARRSEAEAQRFFDAALPVLVQMMTEQGLDAVLRPEAVILGSEAFDMTDEAIARLDSVTVFTPRAGQQGQAPADPGASTEQTPADQ